MSGAVDDRGDVLAGDQAGRRARSESSAKRRSWTQDSPGWGAVSHGASARHASAAAVSTRGKSNARRRAKRAQVAGVELTKDVQRDVRGETHERALHGGCPIPRERARPRRANLPHVDAKRSHRVIRAEEGRDDDANGVRRRDQPSNARRVSRRSRATAGAATRAASNEAFDIGSHFFDSRVQKTL